MHPSELKIEDYTYDLPEDRIAKHPVSPRDASKLLVFNDGNIEVDTFRNIAAHLPPSATIVYNQTKVIHARLIFQRIDGVEIEVFCLEHDGVYPDVVSAMQCKGSVYWRCLVGGARKWKEGTAITIDLPEHGLTVSAHKLAQLNGSFLISFTWNREELSFAEVLHLAGRIPLPPYIKRAAAREDNEQYQTIFAKDEGSVAAPTAALHFTEEVLATLKQRGIKPAYVTLHVGAGTFMPVKSSTVGGHEMHAEWIEVTPACIQQLKDASYIVVTGTTSLRTVESLYHIGNLLYGGKEVKWGSNAVGQWTPYETETFCSKTEALNALLSFMAERQLEKIVTKTQILIAPGYKFRIANALITNFHQPQSTLLLLIAAICGDRWKDIYQYALEHDFRFLSYGDSSLLNITSKANA